MEGKRLCRKRTRRKTKSPFKKISLVLLAVLMVISSGILWVDVSAAEEPPRLSKVGPINDATGYPLWYKDSEGVRLELCLDFNDPLCALDIAEIPNPNEPLSVKTGNFPGESFYMLAGAEMETGSGERARGNFQLEAAFAQEVPREGDQIVFGRVRFTVGGLVAGQTYTITHPYGVDTFIAEVEDEDNPTVGEIRFTEDIGITGGFNAAMDSRIGRFIKWDPAVAPAAPAGYLGDPNVNHKIVGGINGQNYFKIEGPGIGRNGANGAFSPNACLNTDGTRNPNCIQTDLFSVMGKEATVSGVESTRATYSRTTATEGTIDVFAFTEESKAQSLEVTTVEGQTPIVMAGSKGQYFTRISFMGETVPKVTITNKTDNPDTKDEVTPVDKIENAKAEYDITTNTLTVTGQSSDQHLKPTLTVKEIKVENDKIVDVAMENGTATISNTTFVPPNVTIKSAANGEITIPVNIINGPTLPKPPVANAGAEQTVEAGATVTLQGSNSGGEPTEIKWEQVSPDNPIVELTGANTLTPTFTAPNTGGAFVFKLTLTNADGESSSNVTVNVNGTVPQPVAEAGANQTAIKQNTLVTLDGSASTGAAFYEWKQTGTGTPVSLNLSNPAKPTFIAPKKAETLTFELTVRNSDNVESKDTVTVTTAPDNLTVTSAEYDRRNRSWKIDGTSDVFGPNVKVKIYVGSVSDATKLTEVDVDTTGAFRYRGGGLAIQSGQSLIFESTSGGKLTLSGAPLRIR